MNNEIISVRNLSKIYKIHKKEEGLQSTIKDVFCRKYIFVESVKNLNFTISKGEIVGLIGENGAGKTTTLKLLSGILFPTEGEVKVLGHTPTKRDNQFLKKIGFVMGNRKEISWDLPAIDTFKYQKVLYGVEDRVFEENINVMAKLLDVETLLHIQTRRLSLGERMKMELINSFLYSPNIVFLDEPTIGLDLKSQENIRRFIKEYSQKTKCTVIITSHYMDDIEETCGRIIMLEKGQKKYDDCIEKLKDKNVSFKKTIYSMLNTPVDKVK